MKKILLMAAAFLSMNVFAQTQGSDNGFGIKLFAGFGGNEYGQMVYEDEDLEVDESTSCTPAFGLSLDSRWYVANPGSFGIAVNARWIDFSFASCKHTETMYGLEATDKVNFLKAEALGVGPMGTFYLNNDMAIDLYYNISAAVAINIAKETEFNKEMPDYVEDLLESEDGTDFSFGVSHHIGAAFRYKIFQVGVEYNIAKLNFKPEWGNDDDEDSSIEVGTGDFSFDLEDFPEVGDTFNEALEDLKQKQKENNFRVFIGFKF